MERKPQKNGLINLLALAVAGVAGFIAAKYAGTLAGEAGVVFLGIGALVAAVSWFQMRLEEREELEKLEFDELTKSAASSALFNAGETEVFPAQRSREQFERFFVPVFTVVLFLLQGGAAFLILRNLQHALFTPLKDALAPMSIFAITGLILFMVGKYSSNIARLEKLRLLKPGAGYLLLGAYISFIVAGAIAAMLLDFAWADLYVARGLAALLGLIALETLVNLILELYRPRVKGKLKEPVYESRLVSLLGQPEGLVSTARQTLDYQFGFNVSETWAYRLFEQWLPRLILIQVVVLLGSTCFVFINTGEEATLEHFGKAAGILKPGAHFKYPWPVDHVYRYATEQIQTLNVGFVPDDSELQGGTVLWTVPHSKEENFLVANREPTSAASPVNATNTPSDTRPPPVSLLTVGIPVQFQITNLQAWVYNNEDPVSLLSDIATREVVRYLVSVDLQEIMSSKRWDAAEILRARIQAEADHHEMGASIVFVGLQDIHPPVKVAPDYEKVVAAIHTKEANILAAKADAIRFTNTADAQAFKTVAEAKSSRLRLEMDALAQAGLFTNQIPAYLASPSVYMERAYLQTFANSITNARTYVMLATNTQDVIILDLEDKVRPDLLDKATLPPPKAK